MTFYWLITAVVLMQRGIELTIAKRNESWIKNRGGMEYGEEHYSWIVFLHAAFFAVLTVEVWLKGGAVAATWPLWLSAFVAVQLFRIWVLVSLGRFWNTKILILPGEKLVKKGPYRWIKHPNYWIVASELVLLPLIFNAWMTAVLFTILNGILLLFVRIPKEEAALQLLVKSDD